MIYKKSIKKISPYKPGLSEKEIKQKNNLDKVIKLASNENSYGMSQSIKDYFNNMDNAERYPDNYCTDLRSALSKKLGIEKGKFIFGNGSVEIIQMISRILIEYGDEVITCSPTFQSYFLETFIEGGNVVSIPLLKNFKFDLEGILNKITSKTKIIYISNPNNPTGTIIEDIELISFLDKVPNSILVVLDEAYAEFVNSNKFPNSLKLIDKYSNICVLKTFSKAYGLASFRIGYGIANEELIEELEKVRVPFNVSAFSQKAAVMALEDEVFLNNCIKKNRQTIEFTYKKLDEYNIDYIETETNFIMINTKNDGNLISEKLQKNGFIVRPGFPDMESYLRVTIGTKDEMNEFIECLNKILKEN